jgi:hypothetical protein
LDSLIYVNKSIYIFGSKILKRKIIIISTVAVLVLVLSGILSYYISRNTKVEKLTSKGSTFIQENNFTEAKKAFSEAISLTPKSQKLYLGISKQYEEKGMLDSAFEVIKKGCENTNSAELKNRLETIKSRFPVTAVEQTIPQNSKFALPEKATINIDNEQKNVSVIWDPVSINTEKISAYTINGIAPDYERKVILSLRIEPFISEVKDLNSTIKQNAQYTLPATVNAGMSDGTYKKAAVTWNPSAADVNTPGVYEFTGTIEGFTGNPKLTLTVVPLEQQVEMSSSLKTSLDTFFSNFSEAYVKPFEEDNISDDALIDFGIMHIIINNWWTANNLVEKRDDDPGHGYIKSSDIDNACYRYFGEKPTTHKSIQSYPFADGYYKFPYADGEPITFSQIDKLIDIGDNFYRAEVSIYEASNNFKGDVHDTMSNWKSKFPGDVPELKKKMTAKIKKITENGKERYILISYK